MTYKEFWQLKTGDIFKDNYRERLLIITKREVLDEVVGMIISKSSTTDIYNGRKYVQLYCEDFRGNKFYYDSLRTDLLKYYEKV